MKRILFVDDEDRILEGLQRMLRPLRKQWEMSFATSGRQALEVLAAGRFDVIVSDMRMPGMDGAQLLQLVRERYPGIVRIVLSGQFEAEAAIRAAPVAHQFLAKPCDPTKLQAVIERFCDCDSIVSDEATRRIIAAVGELPALPGTYATLANALNDPNVSLDQLGAIVERDVAVAAKVLQLVNSAFFGFSGEIATVPMAVAYLRFEVLKQLVMTIELFRSFGSECRVAGFSVDALQRHCRCAAGIAAHLPLPPQLSAATSVAALLHDVGKLILAARLPEAFERALLAAQQQNRPLHSIETELTGISHAEIGAYLLALWGLPPAVVTAVSQHHHPIHPTDDQSINITQAVQIVDLLTHDAAGTLQGSARDSDPLIRDLDPWLEFLPDWRRPRARLGNGRRERDAR